jgi:hypothetical protein
VQLDSKFDYLKPFEAELVRVGPKGDGGYVVPKEVASSIKSLYSVGISTNWDFEIGLAKLNPNLNIWAYDRTSGSAVFGFTAFRDLLKGDPSVVGRQSFVKRLLSFWRYASLCFRFRMFFRGRRQFDRKWVRESASGSDAVSFRETFTEALLSGSSLLKMDIEGGEYELSDDLVIAVRENHQRISCIVMELHETHEKRGEFEQLVKGISEFLPIVHIHANNCAGVAPDGLPQVVEITFAKATREKASYVFPLSQLDYPNDSNLPDIVFSFSRTNEN